MVSLLIALFNLLCSSFFQFMTGVKATSWWGVGGGGVGVGGL